MSAAAEATRQTRGLTFSRNPRPYGTRKRIRIPKNPWTMLDSAARSIVELSSITCTEFSGLGLWMAR